jgi:hypothetical protein
MSGQFEPNVRSTAVNAIWLSSILPSTANSGAVMSSSRLRQSHHMVNCVDRATVRQKKTGMLVRFELSEQTREAVDSYIKAANKKPGEYLSANRQNPDSCVTTRRRHWIGSELFWDAFPAANQGNPYLSAHRGICVPSNCYLVIPRSKAPSAIWVSSSTMRWPYRRRSRSELRGQSGKALSALVGQDSARRRLPWTHSAIRYWSTSGGRVPRALSD